MRRADTARPKETELVPLTLTLSPKGERENGKALSPLGGEGNRTGGGGESLE
jgi:hypothetical protein